LEQGAQFSTVTDTLDVLASADLGQDICEGRH